MADWGGLGVSVVNIITFGSSIVRR